MGVSYKYYSSIGYSMFGRLRHNVRAAISGTTALSVVVITAILGAAGAGLALVSGLTTIGYSVAFSAVVAGVAEFFTLYQNPAVPTTATITVKALLTLVIGGAIAALEYLTSYSTYTLPTIVAAVAVFVAYLQHNLTAAAKLKFAKKP